tara:strand:+ start:925 stop:1638 length:714 start_codon:yes stop_codon:yes gene_type:complete
MSQMKRAKKAKAIKARKEKEKTKLDKLNEKIKKLQGSIKTREATKLGGAFKAQTDKKKKELETLKLQKKTLTSPLPKSRGGDFETSKTNQPSIRSGGRDFEKPLKTQQKPVKKSVVQSSSNKKSGSVKPINTSPSKPKTETPKAGPAELGSQRSTKEKDTTIDKSAGRDSREDGIGVKIARALGDKRSVDKMISDRKESEAMEEEMNLRKGGAVAKKYGMREGGFTKRGGMYKKGYS